jgi:hypothetical protein
VRAVACWRHYPNARGGRVDQSFLESALRDKYPTWRKDCRAPDWAAAEVAHDWKNHVPMAVRGHWGELSDDAKMAFYFVASLLSESENWD